MSNPLLQRRLELDELEGEYEYAREFVRSSGYQKFSERLQNKINHLILMSQGTIDSNFILGQCFALVKELNQYEDIIKQYESKKKTLEELVHRHSDSGSTRRPTDGAEGMADL